MRPDTVPRFVVGKGRGSPTLLSDRHDGLEIRKIQVAEIPMRVRSASHFRLHWGSITLEAWRSSAVLTVLADDAPHDAAVSIILWYWSAGPGDRCLVPSMVEHAL